MRGFRLLRTAAGVLGCVGVLLFCGGTPAYAHTALKEATPAPGARAAAGTDVVALTFNDLKSGIQPKISMVGPDGTAIPVGRPVVTDGTTACAAVSPLPVGVVTLTYAVTAGDGDVQSSAFQFEVVNGTGNAATPSACAGLSLPAPDDGASGTTPAVGSTAAAAVLAGVVAILAGGGFLGFRRRRRTASREGGSTE
ncbi:copper resistance CopC family protein [Streptomyces sp. NY05-11A]|uniref:copper resistance CopC family protein n=1 Tax=Streptomyces soliscabiei TaxID=588897 RepID=UPI0029A36211|nr:copper resistance protein CopC [Streptomyces sp. NY05-11A]MDX2681694.1 copper resistance protein CopC [Streptomyces sp. NY05-11A]